MNKQIKAQKPNNRQLKAADDLLFIKYDKDHNGALDYQEVVSLMNENFRKRGLVKDEVTAMEFEHFMEKADQNKDGKIDKDEMYLVLQKILQVL